MLEAKRVRRDSDGDGNVEMSELIGCGFDDARPGATMPVHIVDRHDCAPELSKVEEDCKDRDQAGKYIYSAGPRRRAM